MITSLSLLLLVASALTSASPAGVRRAVQELNQAAFEEAQQRDDTATRAFSNTAIKVCIRKKYLLPSSPLTNANGRHPMENVSPSISYREISAQTSPPSRSLPATAPTDKNGI
jgi:hypothetical protein